MAHAVALSTAGETCKANWAVTSGALHCVHTLYSFQVTYFTNSRNTVQKTHACFLLFYMTEGYCVQESVCAAGRMVLSTVPRTVQPAQSRSSPVCVTGKAVPSVAPLITPSSFLQHTLALACLVVSMCVLMHDSFFCNLVCEPGCPLQLPH